MKIDNAYTEIVLNYSRQNSLALVYVDKLADLPIV